MTAYRNDHDALMTRLSGLVDELTTLRSRTSALRDLERDEHKIERELEQVRREVARVAPTRLPLLERVTVATPCPADWDSMTGDERTRFCGQCQKNVYNVSAMSSEEAESFLRTAGGEACIRLYRRADGTVLTSDCPVGVRRRRRRRAVASLVGGGLVAAGALLAHEKTLPPQPVAGGMMFAPTPTAIAATPTATPEASVGPRPIAGAPPAVPREHLLEAELANVRALLDKRARTKDPSKRASLETEIRAASERVVALTPAEKASAR